MVISEDLLRARHSITVVDLRCLCRAARSSFTAKQSAENVAAVIEGALQHIPRKWSNVQSLFLRTAESAALPIYQVRAH